MQQVILNLETKESKGSLIIFDCTGRYNGHNKAGWGVPNATIDQVTGAELHVFVPRNNNPFILDVFPTFPRLDDTGYEILPYMVGMVDNKFYSGKYRIKLIVTGKNKKGIPFKCSGETVKVLTNSATCCVDELVAKTANVPLNVNMRDDKKKKATELSNLLVNVEWAIKCGLYDSADSILQYIQTQCACC